MSMSDYLQIALQLNYSVSVLVGLWIAARWLPDVRALLARLGAGSFVSNRVGQVIIWVALGVLFGGPLSDLLGVLGAAAQFVLGPSAGFMSTVWGTAPFTVFSAFSTLMTLAVYVAVVWTGYRLWPEETAAEGAASNPLALEEWFVLLAAASLVNRFVQAIVLGIIWLPVPSSAERGMLASVGFSGGWLLGLAIVVVVLGVLLNSLQRQQSTS